MQLVIAEKPSAAFDIAHVLRARDKKKGYVEGDNYVVTWCLGHVVQLAEPQSYNPEWSSWSLDSLPMLPQTFQLQVSGSKSVADQWSVLDRLLNDDRFDTVINACDAGREGELIFRNVYDLSGSSLPMKRLWLDDLTPEGVKKALESVRPGTDYDHLADAARSRSEADWLVGLNATRAMTLKAGGAVLLSIGRVQTPTLALIVDRQRAIDEFVSETFWQVFATFATDSGETWEGQYVRPDGSDRFDDQPAADALLRDVAQKPATVAQVERKESKSHPPKFFDLTTLQREMNKTHGLSAQRTLDCAQALYSTHKVLTYPRTSSRYLPETITSTLKGRVDALASGPFEMFADQALEHGLELGSKYINNAGVTDHHAIIPTEKPANLDSLNRDEQCVYEAVVRRFLAAFFPPARFAKSTITARVADHSFVAKGKVLLEEGWQIVEPPSKSSKDNDLPPVDEGATANVADTRLHEGSTRPPDRFNEASLLGAMETAGTELDDDDAREAMKDAGLGTDATRAGIIETLLARDYIERQGKHLVPTPLGSELIDALPDESLKSPELTGKWETALTYMERGKIERPAFMAQVRKLASGVVENIIGRQVHLPSAGPDILGTCPLCKADVLEGKKAYYCKTGRDCDFVIFKKIAGKRISTSIATQLLEGKTTQKLKGFKSKAGKKFSTKLTLGDDGKVKFVFDD